MIAEIRVFVLDGLGVPKDQGPEQLDAFVLAENRVSSCVVNELSLDLV